MPYTNPNHFNNIFSLFYFIIMENKRPNGETGQPK